MSPRMHRSLSLLVAGTAVLAFSCRHTSEYSGTKVVGGTPINNGQAFFSPQDKSVFIAIVGGSGSAANGAVASAGTCTGTFIAHNLLLTAAHCITGTNFLVGIPIKQPDGKIGFQPDGNKKSLYAVMHPDYKKGQSKVEMRYSDVAVIFFSERAQTPDRIAQLADPKSERPRVGDPVTLIGYGKNDLVHETGDAIKRMGRNTVSEINDQWGLVRIQGIAVEGSKNDVEDVIGGQGDSGGPLYSAAGKVIGVLSTNNAFDIKAGKTKVGYTEFADVTAAKTRSFIDAQLAKASGNATPPPADTANKAGTKVGGYTCEEQKSWGKCKEPWMTPACDYVCK